MVLAVGNGNRGTRGVRGPTIGDAMHGGLRLRSKGIANYGHRTSCNGCGRPKREAMNPSPAIAAPPGSPPARTRNQLKRDTNRAAAGNAKAEEAGAAPPPVAKAAAPAPAVSLGRGAHAAPPATPGAPAKVTAHLGLTLAKLGPLEARYPCPAGWSPPKSPADFVAAASAASANDRLAELDEAIADHEQILALQLKRGLASAQVEDNKAALAKLQSEREKLGKLPPKGAKAAAHRWEQASSKARGDAEERLGWEQRGATNALKRLQEDLDALEAAATEIASRKLEVTAAHTKSAQAWKDVTDLKAAYDKEVEVCFQEKWQTCFLERSKTTCSEDASLEDDQDADAFSEVAEDAADEECPLQDLCLRVDLSAIGEMPTLTLTSASAEQRKALDALNAAFKTIPEMDTIPHATYAQLGLVDAEHAAMVAGMVGAEMWKQLYGHRTVTANHWVPTQVANILRKQVERVMAQLPADPDAVKVALERMAIAREDAQRCDRTRRGHY